MLRQTLLGLVATAAVFSAPNAHAGDVWWSVSVGLPAVAFNVPPPIAYPAPPPMVYAPPVAYAPPPVDYAPPPVRYRVAPRPPVVAYNGYPIGDAQATYPGWGPRPDRHDWHAWKHERRERRHWKHDND
uniref:Putative Glutelin n=1 Tax=mine drainage metagenome TaxID=410659 RepID=E6PKV3_9ZZZZ